MPFSTETIGGCSPRAAAMRNMPSALPPASALSAPRNQDLTDSLSEVINGISQVIHASTSIWQIGVVVLAPVVSVVLARWSSNTAKVSSQAAAVKAAVADPNTPIAPDVKETIVSAAKAV